MTACRSSSSPEDRERWLDCKTQEPRAIADLLKPVEDDYFEAIPVGDLVNKVDNTGPEIQRPIVDAPEPARPKQSGCGHEKRTAGFVLIIR